MSKIFKNTTGGVVLTLVLLSGFVPLPLQAKDNAQTSATEKPAQPQPVFPAKTKDLKPAHGLVGSSKSNKKKKTK